MRLCWRSFFSCISPLLTPDTHLCVISAGSPGNNQTLLVQERFKFQNVLMFRSSATSCSYQDDLQEEEFVPVQDGFLVWLRTFFGNFGSASGISNKALWCSFSCILTFFILRESLWAVQEISTPPKPSPKHKETRIRPQLCSFMILLHIFYIAGVDLKLWY